MKMDPSIELTNFIKHSFERLAVGDPSVVDRLIARQDGCLLIGTGEKNWYTGYKAVTERLKEELSDIGNIGVGDLQTFVEGNVGWASDRPKLSMPDGSQIPLRMTFVLHKEDNEWKFVQWHVSMNTPDE
jgi:hypothetical protein